MLKARDPVKPVYCVYPHRYQERARIFIEQFPGRVLYAIKANNEPSIVKLLHDSGINQFDCASIAEIELARSVAPSSTCYFMNPVRHPGDAHQAATQLDVRHFVADDESGLRELLSEITPTRAVVFIRMAVSHQSASENLSAKFGARPKDVPKLLKQVHESGAEAALAFNVGSGVADPRAYAYALSVAQKVLEQLPFEIRLLDCGGGFPHSYPNYSMPPLEDFLSEFTRLRAELPLAKNGELLAEPGRALSAVGLSAVTRVLLAKPGRLYLNDGMYGIFWELRCNGQDQFAYRTYRRGELLTGACKSFHVFGPTCDSSDRLPTILDLPATISAGDHIEFGDIGAYSLSGRTDFNGFYSDDIVTITDQNETPPTGASNV